MGFRDFLFRGNLVHLAVAVVIGTAFSDCIKALTEGMITPLLGIFGSVPEFKEQYVEINKSRFKYGMLVDSLINFFITALVLYYVVIVPADWVLCRIMKMEDDANHPCPECCSKINRMARRCPFCTSDVKPVAKLEVGTEEGDPVISYM